MPDLRMRADQMRFYDHICKCKIAAFILHFCTSDMTCVVIHDELQSQEIPNLI